MYLQQDWQHPYVNVFKKFSHLIEKKGDSNEELDAVISKRVYRVNGAISANNYISIPDSSKGAGSARDGSSNASSTAGYSLGLTGEYIYIQMRTVANRYFSIHLDFNVAERSMLERISLSNMHKEAKAQSRAILLPLQLPSDKWTTVCLGVPEVLAMFNRAMPNAHNLRKIQVCST